MEIDQSIQLAMQGIYFISGIDTDIGKTIATGQLAATLQRHRRVITQKLIQTGNERYSDDLRTHRQLMNGANFYEDHLLWEGSCQQGSGYLTAPICLAYPASPHLALRLDNRTIDWDQLPLTTQRLAERYDIVLVEGAGGVLVPLNDCQLTLEYVAQHDYPLILVTSGRLGSINHTLLSLLAIQHHHVRLFALIFNHYHDQQDRVIASDTVCYLKQYLHQHFPHTFWFDLDPVTT